MKNSHQTASESNGRESRTSSFADRIRELQDARRKWSQRCMWIGGLSLIAGMSGCNFSQTLHAGQGSKTLIGIIDVASICLIAFGAVLIALGPTAWFWRRRTR